MTESFKMRFHLKTYLRVLALIYPAVLFPSLACYGLLIGVLFTGTPNTEKYSIFIYLPIILFVVKAVLLFLVMIYIIVLTTIPALVSHLDVTDQGLEYRYWPLYQIRCQGKDVASLTKRRETAMVDAVLLNRAEEMGWPVTMKMRKLLGLNTQSFIPLSTLEGWPDGRLAELLRQYVPHLFPE
jgi:hypothetical protein